jgi:hypothetical protein
MLLSNYFEDSIKKIQKPEFLKQVTEIWRMHSFVIQHTKKIFSYLDRYYTQNTKHVERKPLIQVGTDCFRDKFNDLKEEAFEALLEEINKERKGEIILDHSEMQEVFSNFDYSEEFENLFMTQAVSFYMIESNYWIEKVPLNEYLEKIEHFLKQERLYSRFFFNSSFEFPLITNLIQVLISPIERILGNEENLIFNLFKNNQFEELSTLYRLFKSSNLIQSFLESITFIMTNEIEKCKDDNDSLLEILRKLSNMFHIHFYGDRLIVKALNNFMKKIKVEEISISQFVFEFVENEIKNQSSEKLEIWMENNLPILKLIEEKDEFMEYYRIHLSMRLLSSNSDQEIERRLISKIKVNPNKLMKLE